MKQLADTPLTLRELTTDEIQQISGGNYSADISDLKDFHPVAWPKINVMINEKIFKAKTFG